MGGKKGNRNDGREEALVLAREEEEERDKKGGRMRERMGERQGKK